jgi:hypothetical protein
MKGNTNPFVASKSADNKGVEHGSGIPGKYGIKKGTFTEDFQTNFKALKTKPPRKFG